MFTGLVAGLTTGYLLQGWQSRRLPAQLAANGAAPTFGQSVSGVRLAGTQPQPAVNGASASAHGGALGGGRMPTLQELNQIADKQAAPLLEKLKSDPSNSAELIQVAAIYHTTHRFKEAADYYGKAVQVDPRNVALRTKLATSLYRSGDVDGALAELNRALTYDPKDANALFDLGMIRLQGKQDGQGALAAWQKLLKTNPQMSSERRAEVEKLMADELTTLGEQHGK